MNEKDLEELRKYIEKKVNEAKPKLFKMIEEAKLKNKQEEEKARLETIESLKKKGYVYSGKCFNCDVFSKKGEKDVLLSPLC
jgi:predicted Ser/Thr protein kinase